MSEPTPTLLPNIALEAAKLELKLCGAEDERVGVRLGIMRLLAELPSTTLGSFVRRSVLLDLLLDFGYEPPTETLSLSVEDLRTHILQAAEIASAYLVRPEQTLVILLSVEPTLASCSLNAITVYPSLLSKIVEWCGSRESWTESELQSELRRIEIEALSEMELDQFLEMLRPLWNAAQDEDGRISSGILADHFTDKGALEFAAQLLADSDARLTIDELGERLSAFLGSLGSASANPARELDKDEFLSDLRQAGVQLVPPEAYLNLEKL